jgi:hypothetical protein
MMTRLTISRFAKDTISAQQKRLFHGYTVQIVSSKTSYSRCYRSRFDRRYWSYQAANLKLSYADDRWFILEWFPSESSIFVINELPDLQARIQVALFNILQEGDIQIRGFKLRMPLDMQFVFMLILKIIQTVVVL